jgi:hypothetical protein
MAARFGWAISFALLLAAPAAAQTSIILDDFNVDEGHFNRSPGFSGSSNGFQKLTAEYTTPPPEGTNPNPSTADHDTTLAVEGVGSEKIVLNDDLDATTFEPTGGSARLRFLSGTGTTTNNTPFSTTTAGTDGWIGFYLKTDSPGWTVSLWIELAPNVANNPGGINNNSGTPKEVIADNEWHLYEWNLDDDSGLDDGWGTVAGIIDGTSIVEEGNHTVDSIIFRTFEMPPQATFFVDFLALNRNGSVADILPPPPPEVDGDFDGDGDTDAQDLTLWQGNFGTPSGATSGDSDADGDVDGTDFLNWQKTLGKTPGGAAAVPEPTGLALAAVTLLVGFATFRRN